MKSWPNTLVYYYCSWSVFLRNRGYFCNFVPKSDQKPKRKNGMNEKQFVRVRGSSFFDKAE
jgi:hypothetical protein